MHYLPYCHISLFHFKAITVENDDVESLESRGTLSSTISQIYGAITGLHYLGNSAVRWEYTSCHVVHIVS